MAPSRIMIIRHAEKPSGEEAGVDAAGNRDARSLSVRGWQRAGALGCLFLSHPEAPANGMVPDAVYAAGVGKDSESLRPQQTMEPLMALLRETRPDLSFVTSYLNHQCEAVAADLMSRDGTILLCWEHKRIPDVVRHLPDAPPVPLHWPEGRYDLIWLFDPKRHGWRFRQLPQLLLAGDTMSPIA